MELCDFIEQISFRYVQPDEPMERFLNGTHFPEPFQPSAAMFTEFELLNTILPTSNVTESENLRKLLTLRRMSTLAIAGIISKAVQDMPPDQSFTNVGVWNGFTFFSGMVNNPDKRCIGIDDFSQFGGPRDAFLAHFKRLQKPNHVFFEMDYRVYFETKAVSPIGVYLYDGSHSYEHQLEALRRAEPFLANDALIIVDDINWRDPRDATYAFVRNSQRQYELEAEIHTAHDSHPTFWNGILVLRCK